MRLPDANAATVDPVKIVDYLLSAAHPVGGSKARFFRALGFDESNTTVLEQGLLNIGRTAEVAAAVPSPHGTKYVVDGLLRTPSGDAVRLRTIWIIDRGETWPRFVTAYPL